jgi:hypothetical protein
MEGSMAYRSVFVRCQDHGFHFEGFDQPFPFSYDVPVLYAILSGRASSDEFQGSTFAATILSTGRSEFLNSVNIGLDVPNITLLEEGAVAKHLNRIREFIRTELLIPVVEIGLFTPHENGAHTPPMMDIHRHRREDKPAQVVKFGPRFKVA